MTLSGNKVKEIFHLMDRVIRGTMHPVFLNRKLPALLHLMTKAIEWKWIDLRSFGIIKLKEDGLVKSQFRHADGLCR